MGNIILAITLGIISSIIATIIHSKYKEKINSIGQKVVEYRAKRSKKYENKLYQGASYDTSWHSGIVNYEFFLGIISLAIALLFFFLFMDGYHELENTKKKIKQTESDYDFTKENIDYFTKIELFSSETYLKKDTQELSKDKHSSKDSITDSKPITSKVDIISDYDKIKKRYQNRLKYLEKIIEEEESNIFSAYLNISISLFILLIGGRVLYEYWIHLNKIRFALQLNMVFKRNLDVISPITDLKTIKLLKHEWAIMNSKEDFEKIYAYIQYKFDKLSKMGFFEKNHERISPKIDAKNKEINKNKIEEPND